MVYDYDTKAERIRHDLFHNRFKDTEWFRVHAKQLDTWLKLVLFRCSTSFSLFHSHESGIIFCVIEDIRIVCYSRVNSNDSRPEQYCAPTDLQRYITFRLHHHLRTQTRVIEPN